jgi:hypothetical protein
MDLLKALLGNGYVNSFQHATMGAVFCMYECYSSLLGNTAILTKEEVFSACFAPRNSRSFLYGPCRVYITRVCLQLRLDKVGELGLGIQSQEPRRLEIELENWVEFWRVDIPR